MTFEQWWAENGSEFDPKVQAVFASLWRAARRELVERVEELENGMRKVRQYTEGVMLAGPQEANRLAAELVVSPILKIRPRKT